jgi:hypothetical protein
MRVMPVDSARQADLISLLAETLLPERKRQFAKPSLHSVRLDGLEVLTVHTRRALVAAALR